MYSCCICEKECYFELLCNMCGKTCCMSCHNETLDMCQDCEVLQIHEATKHRKIEIRCSECKINIVVDDIHQLKQCQHQECALILCKYCYPLCYHHGCKCWCSKKRFLPEDVRKCHHCKRTRCLEHIEYMSSTNICCTTCATKCHNHERSHPKQVTILGECCDYCPKLSCQTLWSKSIKVCHEHVGTCTWCHKVYPKKKKDHCLKCLQKIHFIKKALVPILTKDITGIILKWLKNIEI